MKYNFDQVTDRSHTDATKWFVVQETLDIPDVFQNDLICELRYDRVVTESCKLFKAGLSVFLPGLYLIVEYLVWLPAKDITYRFCCVFLKLLMFEF